jgi:hypothetical protein
MRGAREKLCEAIGDEIARDWERDAHDPRTFADIAARVVEKNEDHLRSAFRDPLEVVRWMQTAPWPEQADDNEYGAVSVAFSRSDRFYVELIYWYDGATAPHEHSAPGLIYDLHGERLHATYDFERREETLGRGLTLGHLVPRVIDVMRPGDYRKIGPNDHAIHGMVFLGHPCVTFSIRSVGDRICRYECDHVRLDVTRMTTTMDRLLRAFEVFVRLHPDEDPMPMAHEVLRRPDVDIQFAQSFLRRLRPHVDRETLLSLTNVARERFGDWIDDVIASCDAWVRSGSVTRLLSRPSLSRESRLLLGLVFLRADRPSTRDLFARMFPGEDPIAVLDRWTTTLCGRRSAAQDFAVTLGLEREDDVSALVRELRLRVA